MSTEEPKKPPVQGGLDDTETAPVLRQKSSRSVALKLEGEWVPLQEGVEDTVQMLEFETSRVQMEQLEQDTVPALESACDKVSVPEPERDVVPMPEPERDVVPTSAALQVYVPQLPVSSPQGTVAVVRPRQEQLRQAQQTLLKLMADYTAIVLYLL